MSESDLHPHARGFARRAKVAVFAMLAAGTLWAQANASQPRFVAAQGRIVPAGDVITVAASHDGGTPIVGKLFVSEGSAVKAGTRLAELTTFNALQEATNEARAQAHLAILRLDAAHQSFAEIMQARLGAAKAEITLAEKALAEAQAAQDTAEKTLVEATAQLQAQQARLSGNWAENKRILDNDGPPAREAAQIRFEQKMLDLQKAELATANAGTTVRLQAQIAQTQAAVETAQQRVANAKAAYKIIEAETRNAEINAAVAKAEHEVTTRAVDRAKELAKTAIITSPIEGTVLQVNSRAGEAVSQEGLVLIGDLSKLYVEAEVYIDDLRHVKIGQQAKITGEAFAGELSGTVERIGQIVSLAEIFARDPASFTDQRVVKVRVALNADAATALPVYSRVLVRIDRQ